MFLVYLLSERIQLTEGHRHKGLTNFRYNFIYLVNKKIAVMPNANGYSEW
jgi:hypothetical protein